MIPALFAAVAVAAGQPADLQALNAAVRLPPAAVEAHALRSAGLARTAIERRTETSAAALGFLCGLKESADRSGGATARGSDEHGRFLGAKLSLKFR